MPLGTVVYTEYRPKARVTGDSVPVGVGVWRTVGVGVWRIVLREVQGGPLRLVARIAPPLEELLAPEFGYLASSWRSCAPSWHQDAILVPLLSPSCIKMASRWPNIAQDSAKMS